MLRDRFRYTSSYELITSKELGPLFVVDFRTCARRAGRIDS